MSKRLSERQREVLEVIEFNCRPVQTGSLASEPRIVPVYMGHLGNMFQHSFWYESELYKFIANLEKRGFVRVEKREFIYITEEGRALITGTANRSGQTYPRKRQE